MLIILFMDLCFNLVCREGHLDIVKLLIENGVEVNKESSNERTALFYGNIINYVND